MDTPTPGFPTCTELRLTAETPIGIPGEAALLCSEAHWIGITGNWPEAHLLFLPLLPRQVLAQGKQGAGGIHQHSLSAPWSTQCLLSVHTGICPVSTGIALPGKRLPPCFVLQLVNVTLELFP